jgi:hypothetical protein
LIKNVLQASSSSGVDTSNGVSNAWTSMGHELALEGVQSKKVEHFRIEIMAYTRHLINGGEPYWKREPHPVEARPAPPAYTPPKNFLPPRDSITKQRSDVIPPAKIGQRRRGRAASQQTDHRQQGSTQPLNPTHNSAPRPPATPDGTELGLGMNPKHSASPLPSSDNETTGSAQPSQSTENPSLTAPSKVPTWSLGESEYSKPQKMTGPVSDTPGFTFDPQKTEQKPIGSSLFGQPRKEPEKPSGFGQSTGGVFGTPSGAPTTTPSPNTSGGLESIPNDAPATGSLFGQGSLLGAVPQNEKQKESGVPFAFGQPSRKLPNPDGVYGALHSAPPPASPFGAGNTKPASFSFGAPQQQQQKQTQNTSLFGSTNQSQTPVDPNTLHGSYNLSAPVPADPFGINKPNTFSTPTGKTGQFDELKELFDHMFDLDDSIPEIIDATAGAIHPIEATRPTFVNEPTAVSSAESIPKTKVEYSVDRGFSFTPEPENRAGTALSASSTTNLPPPQPLQSPSPSHTILLKTARQQLENATAQLRNAQRSGDILTVARSFAPSINERVAYLRSAGAIVVQCDLCIAPVFDMHWTCGTCNNGDWDACVQCVEQGGECPAGHELRERSAKEWARTEWSGEKYWTVL